MLHPTADAWAVAPSDLLPVVTVPPEVVVATTVAMAVAWAAAWAAAVAFSSFLRLVFLYFRTFLFFQMYPNDPKTHGCLGAVLLQWSYVQQDDSGLVRKSLRVKAAEHMDRAINLG